MLSMLVIFTLMTLIPALLLTMNSTLSKKTLTNLEKSSPFECGFDPQALSRLPFSVQFFLVSMIFLIFDVEITLLLPIVTLTPTPNMSLMVLSCSFIMILTLGLYFEYLDKSLEWQK